MIGLWYTALGIGALIIGGLELNLWILVGFVVAALLVRSLFLQRFED